MVFVNVLLTVRLDADFDGVRELLSRQCILSRDEPGCVRFDVFHSQADRRFFLLVEAWENQNALDQHRLGSAYVEIYKSQVLPLVDRVPHPSDLVVS